MHLVYIQDADEQLTQIERTAPTRAVAGIYEVLSLLETDPFDPRLTSRSFMTEEYGLARVSPVRGVTHPSQWSIVWSFEIEGDDMRILVLAIGPYWID